MCSWNFLPIKIINLLTEKEKKSSLCGKFIEKKDIFIKGKSQSCFLLQNLKSSSSPAANSANVSLFQTWIVSISTFRLNLFWKKTSLFQFHFIFYFWRMYWRETETWRSAHEVKRDLYWKEYIFMRKFKFCLFFLFLRIEFFQRLRNEILFIFFFSFKLLRDEHIHKYIKGFY